MRRATNANSFPTNRNQRIGNIRARPPMGRSPAVGLGAKGDALDGELLVADVLGAMPPHRAMHALQHVVLGDARGYQGDAMGNRGDARGYQWGRKGQSGGRKGLSGGRKVCVEPYYLVAI
eukprot:1177199-Prorocentrum_minimum.AAC.1